MSNRRPIRVLANADDVIRVLSEEGALTPAEIADRVGIPRPSVYRLLDSLGSIGLTEPAEHSATRLSLRWLHLADRAQAAMSEWRGARRILTGLVDRTRQTAYLSVLRSRSAVCVDWEPGRGIGVLVLKPGRALPLNAGAAGRALLAFAVDVDAELAAGGFSSYTDSTLTGEEELRGDVAQTRARGYAISDEDVTIGIGALGMPVRNERGDVLGCVSIAGLAEDLRARREAFVAELADSARQLGDLANANDEAGTTSPTDA